MKACCTDNESNFNFYALYYCAFSGEIGIMLPVGILLIVLSFYLLGSTADGYLSPALETIAVKLKISESVAGVTFLAFGNGAPDVISALSASGGSDEGIYLAIGALLGAGLFVSGIVASVVILSAPKPIDVLPKVFLRDVLFYMLGPIIVTIAASTNDFSLPFPITFLTIYVIFVTVVFVTDRFGSVPVATEAQIRDSVFSTEERLDVDYDDSNSPNITMEKKALINLSQHNEGSLMKKEREEEDSMSQITDPDYKLIEDHFSQKHMSELEENEEHGMKFTHQKSNLATSIDNAKHRVVWSVVKMKFFLKKAIKSEDSWSEMNWLQKIIYILIDIPFDFLRRLTIPPGSLEQWDRRFAIVFPPLGLTYFFITAEYIDFTEVPPNIYWILLGVSFLASIIIFYTTKQQHGPESFIILYAIFAFVMSILWISWTANVLIDLLTFFGIIFDIKQAFLGITVLAWGNSVGDMMANSAIAKKGYAKMALTGCVAGPLFNLFFGLGISLFKEIVINKNTPHFSFHSSESIVPTVCGA